MLNRAGLILALCYALGSIEVNALTPIISQGNEVNTTTYLLSINLSGPFNCIESLAETAIVAKSMGFELVSPSIPEHHLSHRVAGAVGYSLEKTTALTFDELFDITRLREFTSVVTLDDLAALGWDGKVQATVLETTRTDVTRDIYQALAQRIHFGPESAITVDLDGAAELHLNGCNSISLPCFQELRETLLSTPAPNGIRVIVSHLFSNFLGFSSQLKESDGLNLISVTGADDGRLLCRTARDSRELLEPLDILSCVPSDDKVERLESKRGFSPELHQHWISFFRSLRHTGRLLTIIEEFQTWMSERDPGARVLPDKTWPATMGEDRPRPRARYALIHARPTGDQCITDIWLQPGFNPMAPGAEAQEARPDNNCAPNIRALILASRIMRVRLRQEGLTTLVLMCRPDLYDVAKLLLKDIAKDGINIVTLGDYLNDPTQPPEKVRMSLLEQVTVEMEIAMQAELLTCGFHSSISSAIAASRSAFGLPAVDTIVCNADHVAT